MNIRKGYSQPIFLVATVVLIFIFVLVFWQATSGGIKSGVDSVFNMANNFP